MTAQTKKGKRPSPRFRVKHCGIGLHAVRYDGVALILIAGDKDTILCKQFLASIRAKKVTVLP